VVTGNNNWKILAMEVTEQCQYFCTPCFSRTLICTMLGHNIIMDILQLL